MTPDECLNADWRTVGYEDGVRGIGGDGIQRHRRACAKVDVVPDFDAYQRGREEGLRQFCRPAKGYALGRSGRAYQGVCPDDLEPAFLDGYDDGLAIYRLEQDMFTVLREIRGIDAQIEDAEDDVADREDSLDEDELTSAERKELRAEVRELVAIITDLQRDREILVRELAAAEVALDIRLAEPSPYR